MEQLRLGPAPKAKTEESLWGGGNSLRVRLFRFSYPFNMQFFSAYLKKYPPPNELLEGKEVLALG